MTKVVGFSRLTIEYIRSYPLYLEDLEQREDNSALFFSSMAAL
jgi:hypothetical protein